MGRSIAVGAGGGGLVVCVSSMFIENGMVCDVGVGEAWGSRSGFPAISTLPPEDCFQMKVNQLTLLSTITRLLRRSYQPSAPNMPIRPPLRDVCVRG